MNNVRLRNGFYFRAATGQPFLMRCAECGRENWAVMVASGKCAWCGYDLNVELGWSEPNFPNEEFERLRDQKPRLDKLK